MRPALPVPHVRLDEVAAALDDEQGVVLDLVSGETTLHAVLEALEARGAFRRFSDGLDRWPELVSEFLTIRDERALGRARTWLADAGLLGPDLASG